MNYWLIKSEPYKYSWQDLEKDGSTYWDGVKNYQARNNLKAMKVGDKALYYHSNEGKEIVGVTEIIKEHYQDPTTDDTRWVAVDVKPIEKFKVPVTLKDIKADPNLAEMVLLKQQRLSVAPVEQKEYEHILKMSQGL